MSEFVEIINNDFLFIQAITIEQLDSYRKFYSSKWALMQSPFEDRFELFVNCDVESVTELKDIWKCT
jgi:hypothetical protein